MRGMARPAGSAGEDAGDTGAAAWTRREPPRFRLVTVLRVEEVTPWMLRVTFTGADLAGLVVDRPAASVRLLVPSPGTSELVIPTWNGNEFLLSGGERPVIRTFTPVRVDPEAQELDLDIVVHQGGLVSTWAAGAGRGDPAAVSGPGRGYEIDRGAAAFWLVGDETALPAIGQLLEALPHTAPVEVVVEVAHADARPALPHHPRATVRWLLLPDGARAGDALADAVVAADLEPGTHVWVAGEAAAVQRIRRHLFGERGLPRAHATVRGYWKHGRGGDAEPG